MRRFGLAVLFLAGCSITPFMAPRATKPGGHSASLGFSRMPIGDDTDTTNGFKTQLTFFHGHYRYGTPLKGLEVGLDANFQTFSAVDTAEGYEAKLNLYGLSPVVHYVLSGGPFRLGLDATTGFALGRLLFVATGGGDTTLGGNSWYWGAGAAPGVNFRVATLYFPVRYTNGYALDSIKIDNVLLEAIGFSSFGLGLDFDIAGHSLAFEGLFHYFGPNPDNSEEILAALTYGMAFTYHF